MKETRTGIYPSTYYLPRIRSYQEALTRFKSTKPIRGRTPTNHRWGGKVNPCVPLGRRSDIDTYSIRQDEESRYIELICYGRVVMTYTPDNKIYITPSWLGLMESGMIDRVLGVNAWLDRKKIGMTINDERYVVAGGGVFVLECVKKDGENHFVVHKKDVIYSYYINRKGSNNVRSRYSQFIKYYEGFISLRKEPITKGGNNYQRLETHEMIPMSLMEIADGIGYETFKEMNWSAGAPQAEQMRWKPDFRNVAQIQSKPQGVQCLTPTVNRLLNVAKDHAMPSETQWSKYQRQCKQFFSLIVDDQPEETRTENYYRATLTLLGLSLDYIYSWPLDGDDKQVYVNANNALTTFDTALLRYHSEEMIDKRELKPNQLPNDRYDRLVTIMPTPEQREEFFSRTNDERT